jgi:hypothetical protein
MKRSPLFIYLTVWCASVAISFLFGRYLPSQGSHHKQPTLDTLHIAQAPPKKLLSVSTRQEESHAAGSENEDETSALKRQGSENRAMSRQLLNEAFALPMSDPNRSDTINERLQQLAVTDPLSALEIAASIPSLRDAERARKNILEVWGRHEPSAALAWAKNELVNLPTNRRESQIRAIIRGFTEANPKAAFNYASTLTEATPYDLRNKIRLLGEVIETQVRGGSLTEAQASISLLADGPTKDSLQRELISEWAAFDPTSAAAYVQSHSNNTDSDLKTALIKAWAKNDPAAAATWLSNLSTDDPAYGQATTLITREWSRYDLTASSAWLNSLPTSPDLDRAIATYTYRASQEDPQAAMSWAESINNTNMRNKMMQQVAANWKIDDPQGFINYLDNSKLNTEVRKELESAKSWHPRSSD